MIEEGRLSTHQDHFIVYRRLKASHPSVGGIVFLGGYRSDMSGTKALFLLDIAQQLGIGCLVFDYFGHGLSSGQVLEGTIGRWREDSLAVIDHLTQGPQILVGSSMGGWLMLHVAEQRPERLKGMVGIACAPDFTEELIWNALTPKEKETLIQNGEVHPSFKSYPIRRSFIEEGRKQRLLDRPLTFKCPVHLLHGTLDDTVPWLYSQRLLNQISAPELTLTLVKDGDHRLNEPSHLTLVGDFISKILR